MIVRSALRLILLAAMLLPSQAWPQAAASPPAPDAQPAAALPLPGQTSPAPAAPPAPLSGATPMTLPAGVTPAPVLPADAPAAPVPAAAPPAVPPGATAPTTPTAPLKANVEDDEFGDIPSIMFKKEIIAKLDEMIERINTAQQVVEPTKLEDDLLTQLMQSQPKQATQETAAPVKSFPVFFLNSIIFTSPSEWSVWLNGIRLTNWNNDPNRPLAIVAIDKSAVTIHWKPSGLIWQDLLAAARKMQASPPERLPPQTIELDEKDNSINLTLHPNQTFISEAMQIREGHFITPDSSASMLKATTP